MTLQISERSVTYCTYIQTHRTLIVQQAFVDVVARCERNILLRRSLKQVCVQLLRTLTAWHYPHSPGPPHPVLLCAVQQSTDICWRPGYSSKPLEQTNGRTACRFVNPVPHTIRAVSIIAARSVQKCSATNNDNRSTHWTQAGAMRR